MCIWTMLHPIYVWEANINDGELGGSVHKHSRDQLEPVSKSRRLQKS